ncbi:GNAT family N-acetyltransferase [Actinotalea sp. Marseille-Q4924]|uniref:GNAT family N-acetyltransferase n=1 Tax=Actinotalea sp. Marseille-Q4924 TaxID=2866571 RepID=UPI001CE3FAB4|nr:GNAT family N-acetyltransferase [Actinotalea sp. Marseille-Q4924]
MRVDELTEGDWRRLQSLRLRCVVEQPDVFGWALAREGGFLESHWRLRLRGATWWAVVADDGADVGLLSMIEEPGAPAGERHLAGLWVAPEARRRGAGRALVAAAAEGAAACGASRVTAWAPDDAGVAAFLARCGLRPTGERVPSPHAATGVDVRWAGESPEA